MKKVTRIAMCLCLTGILSACEAKAVEDSRITDIRRNILDPGSGEISIIAHRSCWQNAPENSLLALAHCIQAGVNIVEIDVRRTKDGHLVLLHDKTLDRTTNGSGYLRDHTLSEIKQLKLRNRHGKKGAVVTELTDAKIPTLSEVLDFSRGKLILNLDIKDDAVAQQAFDLVERKGMGEQILVKLREAPDSDRLKNYTLPNGALFMPIIFQCGHKWKGFCAEKLSEIVQDYKGYNPIAFEIVFNDIEYLKEGMTAMQSMNARVWVNTLSPKLAAGRDDIQALEDPDAHWGLFRDMGVNMIQTDYPIKLTQYLNSKKRIMD